MTEMRWKRVESIFHEALSLQGEERARFIAKACQGDDSIRSEVHSLLANYRADDEFLERGAMGNSAPTPETTGPTFHAGVLLGHYEIIQLLGRGGMGEVYLARDQRLGRKVALKILSAGFAGSIERLRREARAASALNHPNILTIYDFGQQSELHYIISEFVDGVQLREKIGRLSMAEALNYARQIGQALEAAHSVGIVHRDIKPENIMVRPDGYIKVLDFGLAKLVSPQSESGKSLYNRLAESGVATTPGIIIGTLNYMSPEQVRGQPADLRTDIWSWGVVLYEMLSGSRPFEAPTPGDVLAAILNKEPLPPGNHQELNHLFARALSKQKEHRYQEMPEALRDLANISGDRPAQSTPLPAPITVASPPLSASSQPTSRGWSRHWKAGIALLVLLAVLGVLGVLAYRENGSPLLRIEKATPVTVSGNILMSAISRDGKYLAYATDDGSGKSLRVRQAGSDTEVQIHPAKENYSFVGITFSFDGQFIYYVLKDNGEGELYRVPIRDGKSTVIRLDIDSPVSFSPDRKQYAFIKTFKSNNHGELILATIEQGPDTILATLKPRDYFVLAAPAWSADGQFILCESWSDWIPGFPSYQLMSVRVSDRQQQKVSVPLPVSGPVWLENGRGVVLVATNSSPKSRPRLLQVSWPGGKISPIFDNPSANYSGLDATADLAKMVTIQTSRPSSIWVASLQGRGRERLVQQGESFNGIAWTKSGMIVSPSVANGGTVLWFIDSNTGQPHSVTDEEHIKGNPTASPDGKYLVYTSNSTGGVRLFLSAQDGSQGVPLTSAATSVERDPTFSRDSQSVVYTSILDGGEKLWRVLIGGAEPTQLTQSPARKASFSPDGTLIACEYAEEGRQGWSIAILDSKTGLPRNKPGLPGNFFHTIPAGDDAIPVRWSADGKKLLYVDTKNGVSNIWQQPIDGGISTQVTHSKEERIFAFAPSPDGSSLAYVRGTQISNVVLLERAK